MTSPSAPAKTPFLNFVAFVLAFGWEGPVIAFIGWRHGATVEIVTGVLFAVFFWSLFGFRLLSALVKHLLTSTSAATPVAAKRDATCDR